MTLEELVKKVRLELREAAEQDKLGHQITSRACLGFAKDSLERYLEQFEHCAGR